MDPLRRALRALLAWLVVLLVLFEEWGWEPLAALAARWTQLPGLRWVERRVARLPPYGALVVLGAPALALLPVKLLALYALAAGYPLLGVCVVVLAKLLGTAIVARLFQLTRPALLSLPWFATSYARWTTWKRTVLAEVRTSPPWLVARRIRRRARVRAGRWWQRWTVGA